MTILREDGYAVAFFDAEVAHQIRPLIDTGLELFICETMLAADHSFTVAIDRDSAF